MKGRRPDPTALKLLKGNPGRRPVNAHEPRHATIDPACPVELTDEVARAEWDRIVGTLGKGHVTVVDRSSLLAYCESYSKWRKLEREAAAQPFTIIGPRGLVQPHPIHRLSDRACALVLKVAAELGITPSSRSRIVARPDLADPSIEPDAFTKFQKHRERRPHAKHDRS